MLCYAMLCYAMLCCAVLCYAMLCYAMLCYSAMSPKEAEALGFREEIEHDGRATPLGDGCVARCCWPLGALLCCGTKFGRTTCLFLAWLGQPRRAPSARSPPLTHRAKACRPPRDVRLTAARVV
jgi:hypothetical protein